MTRAEATPSTLIPRAGVQGVAGGLLLMGFLTYLWGGWTLAGIPRAAGIPIVVVFLASSRRKASSSASPRASWARPATATM